MNTNVTIGDVLDSVEHHVEELERLVFDHQVDYLRKWLKYNSAMKSGKTEMAGRLLIEVGKQQENLLNWARKRDIAKSEMKSLEQITDDDLAVGLDALTSLNQWGDRKPTGVTA